MSFNNLRKTLFYANILNTEAFAELVQLHEEGRPTREIVVKMTEVQDLQQQERHREKVETWKVAVGRDESHDKGGIETARLGMTIERATDARRYAFTGKVLESSPYSLILEFSRRVPISAGGHR